jgi:hypothetical protein|nr:MAG TPA_asm: hypothetical protein [Caudoviricetes sp.]
MNKVRQLIITPVILLSLTACNNNLRSEYLSTVTTSTETTSIDAVEAGNDISTDITLTSFVEALNNSLPGKIKSTGFNISAPQYEKTTNNGDVYSLSINNNIDITFTTNGANNKLTGVMVSEHLSASDTDRVLFLTIMTCTTKVLSPSIDSDEFDELTIKAPIDTAAGGTFEKNINGINYMFATINGTGRIFVANFN